MPNPRGYEILGIGNPTMDQIIPVSDDFLATLPGKKGGMVVVDFEAFQRIIKNANTPSTLIAGGSGANTIKGLAEFGEKCALVGMIGNDSHAKFYLQRLASLGITPLCIECPIPTSEAACLVTPDGDRTCRTYLGSSNEMKEEYILPEYFEGVKLVHIEGYSLMSGAMTEKAMGMAKEAGAKISFDLGSFEIATRYKERIIHLVSLYVDILFGNENEARALTQLPPDAGCDILKNICEVAVIMNGTNGCWVGTGNQKEHYQAIKVNVIDSTGAGDLFASGFLHGYINGKTIAECAHYGTLAGATVVQTLGAEIPPEGWQQIKAKL